MTTSGTDIWSQWLLDRRFGGDRELLQSVLGYLHPIRDAILDHANLQEVDTLLDVGCGDGLIAFGGLQRFQTIHAIFCDISEDLLTVSRSLAQELGVADRSEFLLASADDLSALNEASVDVVTTRSVLIYVKEKEKAFKEFFRVLKSGGRLSIFEPINRFAYPEPKNTFMGYDVSEVADLAEKVESIFQCRQPADTDPMLDFDERDLINMAEDAGFRKISMDYQVRIEPRIETAPWGSLLNSAPNPKAPTLEEAITTALSRDEGEQFRAILKRKVEEEEQTRRRAVVYLWANK